MKRVSRETYKICGQVCDYVNKGQSIGLIFLINFNNYRLKNKDISKKDNDIIVSRETIKYG